MTLAFESENMAHIYFIRHGKPEFRSTEKYCIGTTDLPLSREGSQQMRGMADFIKRANIQKIYVSPLQRSIASGQILSGGQIPVFVRKDLTEIHMGTWEDQSFDSIRMEYPHEYAMRAQDYESFRIPGAETFSDCQERAVAAYREILGEAGDENIAIVGHAGFFRALICWLEGRELNKLMDIPMPYGGIYSWDIGPNVGAVIVAAGLSSRMQTLKPVLPIENGSFLTHEIDTLFRAGTRQVIVVTGRDAEQIEAAAAGPGVSFVYNSNYAVTKMHHSVCLGLSEVSDGLNGAFVLPADSPAFALFTLKQMHRAYLRREYQVIRPSYKGMPGHPLLIRKSFFPVVYDFHGPYGLRGVLSQHMDKVMDVPVPEYGILMDADVPEQYEEILVYKQESRIPNTEKCFEIMKWLNLPQRVINHSVAVAEKAVSLAEAANRAGAFLNLNLIVAAALLHDIAYNMPKHPKTAALWLRQMGMPQVAAVVENHSYLPDRVLYELDETIIVFLADKLLLGDRPCTIEQRYEHRMLEYAGDPAAEEAIRARLEQAKQIYSLYLDSLQPEENGLKQ